MTEDRSTVRPTTRQPDAPSRLLLPVPEVSVPVIYAVAAALWIYYSDYIAALSAATSEQLRIWSTLKGMVFVLLTAGLLFGLLRRVFGRMRLATRELKASREDLKAWNDTLEKRVAERTALAEERAEQLRALALELVRAEQQERRRVARTLHESFQQLLVAAKFNITLMERHPENPGEAPLRNISQAIDEAIRVSRLLTVELSPPILYDVGLMQALQWLGRWMQERHALSVEVSAECSEDDLAEEELRVMLFHAVRELLLNVVKHAGVQSARVDVTCQNDHLRIVVADDGKGFDPRRRSEACAATTGYGLFSIRERLQHVGGRMEIDSSPGRGTRINMIVPIDGRHAAA